MTKRFKTKLSIVLTAVGLLGLGTIFVFGVAFPAEGASDFWKQDGFFTYSLLPNLAVNCGIVTSYFELYPDGTEFRFDIDQTTFNPQFLTVSSALRDKQVSAVQVRSNLICDNVFSGDTIRLVGGSFSLLVTASDSDGSVANVQPIKFTSLSAINNIQGRSVALPTITIPASQINNALDNDVQEWISWLTIKIQWFPQFKNSLGGDAIQVATVDTLAKLLLRVENPAPIPETTQGTYVKLTGITPITYDKASGTVPSFKIRGELDNWTSSEGFPVVDIFAPNGQKIWNNVLMNIDTDKGGGVTEFLRNNFEIGNKDLLPLGIYKFEMSSNNDVRKDSSGKTLKAIMEMRIIDTRTPEETKDIPPPTTCPNSADIQRVVDAQSTDSLQRNIIALEEKSRTSGGLSACEQDVLDAQKAELLTRDTTGGNGTPPPEEEIPTPTGFTLIEQRIRCNIIFLDVSKDCTVPKTPQFIQFQLLGSQSDAGVRFSEVELSPEIILPASTTFQVSRVQVQENLIIYKNNPITQEVIDELLCKEPKVNQQTGEVTTRTDCPDTTFNVQQGRISGVFLSSSEKADVNSFVDTARTIYQFSQIKLTESSIVDKLRVLGEPLAKGDLVTIVLEVSGSFDATIDGVDKTGVVGKMIYAHTLVYTDTLATDTEKCQGLSGEAIILCLAGEEALGTGGECEGLTSQQCLDLARNNNDGVQGAIEEFFDIFTLGDDDTTTDESLLDGLSNTIKDIGCLFSVCDDGLLGGGDDSSSGGSNNGAVCDTSLFTPAECEEETQNQDEADDLRDLLTLSGVPIEAIIIFIAVVAILIVVGVIIRSRR